MMECKVKGMVCEVKDNFGNVEKDYMGWLEKAYSHHYYGLLNAQNIKKYIADGNWFWPYTPDIDEDGFADFTKMEDEKLIVRYGLHQYDPKCELFPIPNSEMLINKKLVQNPGY